jgi:Flp pilus assembly protein TadD
VSAAHRSIQTLIELRRYPDALQRIASELASHPDDAVLHRLAAVTHLANGSPSVALRPIRTAISLRPDDEVSHRLHAQVLGELGYVDAAAEAARQAVRLAPDSWATHASYANALCRYAYPPPAAAAAAARAVELAPHHPEAHFAAGRVAQRMGRHREATAAYQRVLAISPDHSAALNNLGNMAPLRRRTTLYAAALRSNPWQGAALTNVGRLAPRVAAQIRLLTLAALCVVSLVSLALTDVPLGLRIGAGAVVLILWAVAVVRLFRGIPRGVGAVVRRGLLRPAALGSHLLMLAILGLCAYVVAEPSSAPLWAFTGGAPVVVALAQTRFRGL